MKAAASTITLSCLAILSACAEKTNLERYVSIPQGSTTVITDKTYVPVSLKCLNIYSQFVWSPRWREDTSQARWLTGPRLLVGVQTHKVWFIMRQDLGLEISLDGRSLTLHLRAIARFASELVQMRTSSWLSFLLMEVLMMMEYFHAAVSRLL
jgi:hypothetical protein